MAFNGFNFIAWGYHEQRTFVTIGTNWFQKEEIFICCSFGFQVLRGSQFKAFYDWAKFNQCWLIFNQNSTISITFCSVMKSVVVDFEFSSVLRSSGWVVVEGRGNWRRHGWVWSVQQITLYWTFTTSANIYHHVLFSSPFLTLWSSQLDFLQIADKFWIGQFQSSSSFLFFSFSICHMWFLVDKKNLLLHKSDWCKRFFKKKKKTGWIL